MKYEMKYWDIHHIDYIHFIVLAEQLHEFVLV